MARLADLIVVDMKAKEIRIDGEPMPWMVGKDLAATVGSDHAMPTLDVSILAREVQVIEGE